MTADQFQIKLVTHKHLPIYEGEREREKVGYRDAPGFQKKKHKGNKDLLNSPGSDDGGSILDKVISPSTHPPPPKTRKLIGNKYLGPRFHDDCSSSSSSSSMRYRVQNRQSGWRIRPITAPYGLRVSLAESRKPLESQPADFRREMTSTVESGRFHGTFAVLLGNFKIQMII